MAIGVIFFSALIFGSNIWGVPVFVLDEAKNAACADEMLHSESLVIPTFNGELRTDKPPLHYFFMMLSISLFGKSEFSVRLFSVIMGMGTLWVSFQFAKNFFNRRAALYTSLVILSSLLFSMEFHLAVPDPYLIFFMTAGSLTLFAAFQNNHPGTGKIILGYACLGLAALAKGPIALVLPGLGFLIFLIITKKFTWQNMLRINPFLGALVIALVTLPWFIAVHIQTDGIWTEGFFLQHNLGRFTSTMEGHGGFFMDALILALLCLIPFAVFLPRGIASAWKDRLTNPALAFCLSMGSAVILFFLFSSTILPNYLMPSTPFFAILIGYVLEGTESQNKPFPGYLLGILLLLTMAIPASGYFALEQDPLFAGLAPQAWWLVPIPLGVLAAFRYCHSIRQAAFMVGASFMAGVLVLNYHILPELAERNPVHRGPSMENIQAYHYGLFNPAYVFYYGNIPEITGPEIRDMLNANEKFFIITRNDHVSSVPMYDQLEEVFRGKDMFEDKMTVILKSP